MENAELKKEMVKVVTIALREAGMIAFFDLNNVQVKIGDVCLVESDRGKDYGRVVSLEKFIDAEEEPVRKILQVASPDDKVQIKNNMVAAKDAFKTCLETISKHKKEMKLVFIEYSFDKTKMILYFTSEGRIDFRDLVKDLATVFKTRIELRQIGVRDASGIVGGIGGCGRVLCCNSFLRDFDTINIKMAKAQKISLNPSKISGLCGRLLCCLKYEYQTYKELVKNLPKEGSLASTPQGQGTIVDTNILKQTVNVSLDDTRVVEFPLDKVKIIKKEVHKKQGNE